MSNQAAAEALRTLGVRIWRTPFRYLLIAAAVAAYLGVMALIALGSSGGIDWF